MNMAFERKDNAKLTPLALRSDPNTGQNEVNSSLLRVDRVVMLSAYIQIKP